MTPGGGPGTVIASAGKPTFRRPVNIPNQITHMGDRSPKDNQKKTGQKQAKASTADQKKKALDAAKQVSSGKKK